MLRGKKKTYGCLAFFFFNYTTKKMTTLRRSRGAADSGFVGVLKWSSK